MTRAERRQMRKQRRDEEKNGKPGRPMSRAVIVTRKKANEITDSGNSPLDVMWDNMLFWWKHVETLTGQLKDLIVAAESEEERREAFQLLRELIASRNNAQQCAVDMAPYCHPRLQAIAFTPPAKEIEADKMPVDQNEAAKVYQQMIRGR